MHDQLQMKNIAFPVRRKTKEAFGLNNLASGFEILTDRQLDNSAIKHLGKMNFNGSVKHHYFIEKDSPDLGHILERAGIEGSLAENLSRISECTEKKPHFKMPLVMAVANATPDSFYPGSRLEESGSLLDRLIDAGPDIIDVGGESTRPGSNELSIQDEISRVGPVLDYIVSSSRIPVSLDTRHPEVLEHFSDKVQFANDITGFRDNRMVKIAAEASLKCITMHMRGTPSDMQSRTDYVDLVPEVLAYLAESASNLQNAGIRSSDIVIDPGIGFSKDFQGNLEILSEIQSFSVGYSTLVGASRKSFIGRITGEDTEGRLPGTLAVTAFLAGKGVDIIRVHDPKENIQLLEVLKAVTEGRS